MRTQRITEVDVSDKVVTRIDENFDEIAFTMHSSSEAEAFLRTFPDPMPSTHELCYSWETVPNPNGKAGPRRVKICVVPCKAGAAGNAGYVAESNAKVEVHLAGLAAESKEARADLLAENDAARVADHFDEQPPGWTADQLNTKNKPDLATIAAEMGLELDMKLTKADMVAQIIEEQATRPD